MNIQGNNTFSTNNMLILMVFNLTIVRLYIKLRGFYCRVKYQIWGRYNPKSDGIK